MLMLRVRDGEVEQLGVLYERHCQPLLNFFVRLTGNMHLSEDLLQEVFLRMLKYRHTFETGHRFTTWMYRVGRNVHFDSWHKRRAEVPLEPDTDRELVEWACPEPGPDRRVNERQEAALLRQALSALPLELREVLILSRFQDLKYEEIAQVLDCTATAVKMRVHRAMKELKERFTALVGEQCV
jgi:RNA polymerase sigma-70 factor (ECF subfamily)